jgi:signal transduction histidine kinase
VIVALAQLSPALPTAAAAAAIALVVGAREGRRRTALNEALHELRRPLQALVLQAAPGPRRGVGEGPVELAAAALERLDREINGEPTAPDRAPLLARPLAESALGRWRERAAGVGATLELRWEAGGAAIDADRRDIAAALDNLIDNAIEHGGPRIAVEAASFADMLSLAVVDSGAKAGGPDSERPRVPAPNDLLGRLSGRRRHGHGLRRVRRTAAAHGGSFSLHRGESGTSAVLELPLLDRGGRR